MAVVWGYQLTPPRMVCPKKKYIKPCPLGSFFDQNEDLFGMFLMRLLSVSKNYLLRTLFLLATLLEWSTQVLNQITYSADICHSIVFVRGLVMAMALKQIIAYKGYNPILSSCTIESCMLNSYPKAKSTC